MMRRKPIQKMPGRPILKRKVRTQVIDPVNPRAPKGKLNKGAAEPMDTKTRVPAGQNRRSGLAGMLKTPAPAAKKSSQAKQPLMATPIEPNNVGKKKVKKGPGFKDGGLVAGAANRRRRMQEMVNK